MPLDRRNFLRLSAGNTALLYGMPTATLHHPRTHPATAASQRPDALAHLQPMLAGVSPITLEERQTRIQKAQRLMAENKIAAIVLDCGTSLQYFTGISWWPSERTMVAIIPAKGEVSYVSPAFEAERLHQLITIGKEVRVWEEH
jgi:Xaa-Pro dipeptidase